MSTSETTASITIEGREYEVITATPTRLVLREFTTGEYREIHPGAVPPTDVPTARRNPRTLAHIPAKNRDTIARLVPHLKEVLTGIGANGVRRPEYDPSQVSQTVAIARKVNELNAAGVQMSERTFWRRLSSYRQFGETGLIDGRWIRTRGPHERIPQPVMDALLDVLNETTGDSNRTRKYVIDEVRRRVRREHGPDFTMPSQASMHRHISMLSEARYLTHKASTRRSAAGRPKGPFTNNVKILPGAEVQIDSTPLDVLVATEKGPKRPVLTIMIDVATRLILAYSFRLEATTSVDHAFLITQALTPRSNRPSVESHRALLSGLYPQARLLEWAEYERLSAAQPFVRPRSRCTRLNALRRRVAALRQRSSLPNARRDDADSALSRAVQAQARNRCAASR